MLHCVIIIILLLLIKHGLSYVLILFTSESTPRVFPNSFSPSFLKRSESAIFDKNAVKNTTSPHHGIRLMNAHLVPFLNALRTSSCASCGSVSMNWIEVRSAFAWASAATVDAGTVPDLAAFLKKAVTFDERTAAH